MKKIVLIFILVFQNYIAISQFNLSKYLLDKSISVMAENNYHSGNYKSIYLLKIMGENEGKFYLVRTGVIFRCALPDNLIGLYEADNSHVFITTENVILDNTINSKIIKRSEPDFEKFLVENFKIEDGSIRYNESLQVIKVEKQILSRKKYKLTSRYYTCYSKAPVKYWPFLSFPCKVVNYKETLSEEYKRYGLDYEETYNFEMEVVKKNTWKAKISLNE